LNEHGADVNKKNNFGKIPLCISCENGNVDIIKYLVEHGTDMKKENDEGKTPLFYAHGRGNEAII